MKQSHREIMLRHCCPAEPVPTDQPPRLLRLTGVRAVLFDVYGTLLISASGDVGTAAAETQQTALAAALNAVGVPGCGEAGSGSELLVETIHRHHERSRGRGIEYPEVDIRDIWREVLGHLHERGRLQADPEAIDVERLAIEYEARANPVWPMPHLERCLDRLQSAGLALGIVSNAQFFTPELFPALLGRTLEQLGFSRHLQFFSYEFGQAKPGRFLYERAREALSSRSISADEVVYVGNDVLNDVMPARGVGFRTALFAGDARSLRLRDGDPRVAGVAADLVLTDLDQLGDCV